MAGLYKLASDHLIALTLHQFIKEKRKGKKRADDEGLKLKEVSELEKQGEYEAKMTEKDSHQIQVLTLGSPLSKIFKQRYTHNQKILINLSERNKQKYCETGLLVDF